MFKSKAEKVFHAQEARGGMSPKIVGDKILGKAKGGEVEAPEHEIECPKCGHSFADGGEVEEENHDTDDFNPQDDDLNEDEPAEHRSAFVKALTRRK